MQMEEELTAIKIRPLRDEADAIAFRTLNEEWIAQLFTIEPKDREVLESPEESVLRKGGHVFLVYAGDDAIGCAALIPLGSNVYELSKMAVSPKRRGLGIGRKLIEHVIAEARNIGAKRLVLGSSTKLPNAVHLYESVGFLHVPPDKIPPLPYARTDVFMEMPL